MDIIDLTSMRDGDEPFHTDRGRFTLRATSDFASTNPKPLAGKTSIGNTSISWDLLGTSFNLRYHSSR